MIIEFAGLPRSGKSSSIGIIRDCLLRSGWSVRLAGEAARFCPFGTRHRIEFACWAANQALNSVLEAKISIPQDTLVLQDRGLFDALAFFKLLHIEQLVDEKTVTDFTNYFADPRWTQLIDLVILFNVLPETAVERDLAAKLSAGPGVITNLTTMRDLAKAYDFILSQYGYRFSRIELLDTTNADPLDTAHMAIRLIQGGLQD